MISFRYFFPLWPPSVNHTWRSAGKTYLAPNVREFRRAMQAEMLVARAQRAFPKAPLTGPLALEMRFYPPTRQRRDLDNLAKCPLDAFTYCGLWMDDSQVTDLRMLICESVRDGGFWACVRQLGSGT